MAADILTYVVTFSIVGNPPEERKTRVAIGGTSAHETTFGDIPTILAVGKGLGQHPELILIHSAELVSTEPSAL